MEHFEAFGIKISLYQLSAVRIEYPGMESYYSFVPNRHLQLLLAHPPKIGAIPAVMRGTPTNKAEGKRAWKALAVQYPNILAAMPTQDIAWITIDCGDFIEHWFIPTPD